MILIISKNQMESDEIREMLTEADYTCEILPSIEMLSTKLEEGIGIAALIDIDSVPVDNRCVRKLTLKHPSVYFFCMSLDKFHPELKDAICYHIYACLNKPIDPDELYYWMRCIDQNENETRGPPQR